MTFPVKIRTNLSLVRIFAFKILTSTFQKLAKIDGKMRIEQSYRTRFPERKSSLQYGDPQTRVFGKSCLKIEKHTLNKHGSMRVIQGALQD